MNRSIDLSSKLFVEPPVPPEGEHLWTAAILHRIDPSAEGGQRLNEDTILSVVIGCFVCEWDLSPDSVEQPCPGPPETDEE